MSQAAWNTTPPAAPGLYIASVAREPNASAVRYWTGERWTAPTMLADIDLPGRRPDASWSPARDASGHAPRVRWLEPYLEDPAPTAWKAAPPRAEGLYIASTGRSPDTVRYWTGEYWTGPRFVDDEELPDRAGLPDWETAARPGRVVEWLEAYQVDAQGFIAWSGLVDESPVHPLKLVEVKLRSGARAEWPVAAGGFRWRADGSCLDPVAYRVAPK